MENPKQSNNVVKIGHNSNRSITKETVEKISKRFMHILDVVDNNLRLLEQNYFEACTKYPFRSKFNRHESFKKLLPHHVEDARQEASPDNALKGGGARCSEVSSAVCRFFSFASASRRLRFIIALALLELFFGFARALL